MESKYVWLDSPRDERMAVIEKATAQHKVVRAEMASVKHELDALVDAPESGGARSNFVAAACAHGDDLSDDSG